MYQHTTDCNIGETESKYNTLTMQLFRITAIAVARVAWKVGNTAEYEWGGGEEIRSGGRDCKSMSVSCSLLNIEIGMFTYLTLSTALRWGALHPTPLASNAYRRCVMREARRGCSGSRSPWLMLSWLLKEMCLHVMLTLGVVTDTCAWAYWLESGGNRAELDFLSTLLTEFGFSEGRIRKHDTAGKSLNKLGLWSFTNKAYSTCINVAIIIIIIFVLLLINNSVFYFV